MAMKHKSITFRCTDTQMQRLNKAMAVLECENRSAILSAALEEFLHFAEQDEILALNLFELVDRIDSQGSGVDFASQAS